MLPHGLSAIGTLSKQNVWLLWMDTGQFFPCPSPNIFRCCFTLAITLFTSPTSVLLVLKWMRTILYFTHIDPFTTRLFLCFGCSFVLMKNDILFLSRSFSMDTQRHLFSLLLPCWVNTLITNLEHLSCHQGVHSTVRVPHQSKASENSRAS